MCRSARSASSGQASGRRGHHACASCSWSRVTSAPARQPGLADRASPSGWAGRRAPRPSRARARPTTPRRARARASRPGPRRPRPRRRRRAPSGPPTSRPTARGGRRASGRRLSRTTHSAASERRGVVATSRSDQRIGCSSSSSRRRARRRPRAARRARRGRRAAVERRDAGAVAPLPRASAAALRSARRLVPDLAPRGRHLVGLPGSAGEDAGPARTRDTEPVMRAAQALGLGLRGRASPRRRAARGGGGLRGAPRLRLGRGRGARRRREALPPPRVEARPRCAASAPDDARRARCTRTGAPTSTSCAAFRGEFPHPPDVVARPREEELARVLEWCAERARGDALRRRDERGRRGRRRCPARTRARSSVDLGALDRVLEVDAVSRAARIEAGATGPRLEEQLASTG